MSLLPYLQHFTDREEHIAAFDSLWPGDGRWILAFSGVSGNGKSTLINWLIETACKPKGYVWHKVDFYTSPPLEAVPRALAELAGPEAVAHFEQAAARARRRHDEAVDEINRARAGRAFAPSITQQATASGQISGSPPVIDAGARDELRALYGPHQERLEDDLGRAALDAISGLGARPTVLFLDTYERFAEASPPPTVARLWRLLEQVARRAPGLRVVVGGRQDLPFEPLRDWTLWMPLGEFSPQDCDQFLLGFGMRDAALRRKTYELFKGHPLTTRMMAEAFADALKRGQPVTQDILQQGTLARSHDEWLYGLVLQYLAESLRQPAKYGPLLRRFTQATLSAALDLTLDDETFHTLVTRAFVKPVGPGLYAFHETVRRVQIAWLSGAGDPQAAAVHQRIIQNDQARLDPERDALYHACFNDPSGQFDEWRDQVDRAAFTFDHLWWNELLDVMQVSAINKQLNPQQQADVAFRCGRWHYYHDGWDDALIAYAQAGPLYRAAQNVVGEANVLKAQGDVLAFLDRRDEALARYEQALGLFRAVGSRLGEANVLLSRGDLLRGQKQFEPAWQEYAAALAGYQAVGDAYSCARVYYRQGDWHAEQSRWPQSLDLYEKAAALWENVGLRDMVEQIIQPRIARARENMTQ